MPYLDARGYPASVTSIQDHRIPTWDAVQYTMMARRQMNYDMARMQGKRQKKPGMPPVPGGRIRNWIGRRAEGQLNSFGHTMF